MVIVFFTANKVLSHENHCKLNALSLTEEQKKYFELLARQSYEEQLKEEQSDTSGFEEFLANYFSKITLLSQFNDENRSEYVRVNCYVFSCWFFDCSKALSYKESKLTGASIMGGKLPRITILSMASRA